jgi:uncharacterized protein YbbC (DUF1343 family)
MIRNGIDNIGKYAKWFEGKRLGLITAPTGLDRNFVPTYRILHERFTLSALFSPEHGVRGDAAAGATVDTYTDKETGVPVYSLYRSDSKRLTPDMLDQVDMVVYDIQDVGVRFYTFISTMLYALEDCAKAGKPFVVLDRVNPLDGVTVEGNVLKEQYRSFVGGYGLCVRYGLTPGEVAAMANEEMGWNADLRIVRCEGWDRSMLFPYTGLLFVPPSVGIPRFETALVYAGTCLFEGTNVSEGRGTALPFEMIGAPYITDPDRLADEMNRKGLSGVRFRPVWFRPYASKHAGELCGGVQLHITDVRAFRPVEAGVALLFAIRDTYESFAFLPPVRENGRPFLDLLSGEPRIRDRATDVRDVLDAFREESRAFAERKAPFHLY